MSNERYNKAVIELSRLMPADHFRTVESFDMHKVKTETKVEIELKDSFMKDLTFQVPWDGKLYAYVRDTKEFLSFLEEKGLHREDLQTVYIQDWDNSFRIIFEAENGKKEVSFSAVKEDVKQLLENCCRITEQR